MGILHDAPGGKMPYKGHKGTSIKSEMSTRTHMDVGSGSRPTKSKVPIHTTSPHHPQKLDSRHVKGALGQGATKK